MARWKLACSHYINTVRQAKWRYSHTDRTTGENVEKEFIVPRLLDVNDPKCWTNRLTMGAPVSVGGSADNSEGEIIVCHPGKGEKSDVEFLGDPTPDMIPYDEEAETISATFKDHWAYKPDTVDNSGFSQALVDRMEVPSTVEVEGMKDLVAAMTAMVAQNAELIRASNSTTIRRL